MLSLGLIEHGNFCLVSARLSLERHYPFPYFFQSSFNQFIDNNNKDNNKTMNKYKTD